MVAVSVLMGENILVHRKKVVALMLQKVMVVRSTPFNRGSVIRNSLSKTFAPSMVAASYSSAGIPSIPLMKISM